VSNLSNYVGRTVDVSAFQGIASRGEQRMLQSLAFPGKGGTVVTGVAKLGQRFILELLTESGSMPFLPDRGSSFMTEARTGIIRTPEDLLASFSRALLQVSTTLTEEDKGYDRLDEMYKSAEIQNIQFDGSNAVISIRLSSLDPNATAILPVSLVI
jgi:hypothetical protein